jgi:Thiamine pyrophosphate enzyme, C-terminal TPP binding domain
VIRKISALPDKVREALELKKGRRTANGGKNRRISWASMANAAPNPFGAQLALSGRQTIALGGDRGFSLLTLVDLLTQVERNTPVVQIILNSKLLDFVKIEMQARQSWIYHLSVILERATPLKRVLAKGPSRSRPQYPSYQRVAAWDERYT